MAWTNPTSRTTGFLVSASVWNNEFVGDVNYISSLVEPNTLLNQSGSALGIGAVVTHDSGNDVSFTTTTTPYSSSVLGILSESIASGASGRVAVLGAVTACVSGNVTRGNFLASSSTAGRALDAGSARSDGSFAVALTAYAGGGAGSVTALLSPGMVGGGIPNFGVLWTTASSAPTGFSEYTLARGRVIVGLVSGGSLTGTVGTALTDQENPTHTHTYTDVGYHRHSVNMVDPTFGSATTRAAFAGFPTVILHTTSIAGAGIASGSTGASSHVVPYIQLFTIGKD